MAKQNKINKKRAKRRARYQAGTRHDYRQGGRVKAFSGFSGAGIPSKEEIDKRVAEYNSAQEEKHNIEIQK